MLARSFRSSGSNCSPCYVIGLEQDSYTLNEGNTVYSIRLRVLSPADSAGFTFGRPRLRLLGIPGTATENDFSLVTSDILLTTFAGLDVSLTISLDDTAGEPVENFVITSQPPLTSGSNDAMFLFRNSTINIVDADRPTYRLLLTEYSQFEGMDSTCNSVNIMQTSSHVVTDVHLLVTPLTYDQYSARAATDSSLQPLNTYHGSRPAPATYDPSGKKDFSNTAQRIMFPAGSINGFIQSTTFEVLNDDIDEYVEGFILVLDVDTSRTAIVVNFSPSKRTALVNIYDDDPFFFGFEQQQYTYNEQADVGLQEIPFSAAPGNETVKRFSFSIHTTSIKGGFIFAPNGDVSFGGHVQQPTFQYSRSRDERTIVFNIINDNTIEDTEVGQLSISPSTAFDGFGQRFQSLQITIIDDDSKSKV